MERYDTTYIESNRRAILSRLITFSIFNSYAQLIDHSMHLENSYLRQIKNILMSIPVMGTYIKQEIQIRKGTLNPLPHLFILPLVFFWWWWYYVSTIQKIIFSYLPQMKITGHWKIEKNCNWKENRLKYCCF